MLRMGRDLIQRLGLFLACAALTACGAGAQNRPLYAGSFPFNGQVLSGPVQEIRLAYNMDVRILNPDDVRVVSPTRGFLSTTVTQRDSDPNAVYIRAPRGQTFPFDEELSVTVIEGLVVNDLDHYADEPIEFTFTTGAEPPLLFGRPGQVTLLDSTTFASLGDVPTPGGRDPVGIVSTLDSSGTQRVWVQLASGGGTGASIAWFETGDATMTAIPLPASADLVADAAAITVDPSGRYVYAAFRDTGSERVRLVRVDTATATSGGSIQLESAAAGAATKPLDLRWTEDEKRLFIPASTPTTGVLAFVELETFTEQDRDENTPGIQGYALPDGPGPTAALTLEYWVSVAGGSDTTTIVESNGDAALRTGDQTGVGTSILAMPDRQFLVQGLAGFTGDTALQIRTSSDNIFGASFPVDLSDDVGGVDQGATSVVTMQHLQGQARFAVLLDSPGGLLLARVEYAPFALFQEDLDPVTDGIQVVDVESEISGATVIGRTFGLFAP